MKRREEILRDLETMQDLPSLPRVITRLQQEINKPEHDIETIARIIAEDPPIALKVLKVVNSPMYRALRKVVSIHEAALRLGLKEISEILLATPLSDLRKNQHGVDFSRFWNHSISVAHAARAITSISSSRMNAVTKHMGEAVFTAALLHDIGMLMLNKYSPEVYDNINEAPENNLQPPISVIEKKY